MSSKEQFNQISPSEFFYRNRDLAGFSNALKWTTTEPESAIAADETFDICQKIEIFDYFSEPISRWDHDDDF